MIAENPKGRVEFVNDELLITSKRHDGQTDAAAVRLRSANRPVIGKLSFDDEQGRERLLLTGDLQEGFKFQGNPTGETTDAAMRPLMSVSWDGIRYHVPVIGAGASSSHEMRHPNGVIWWAFQGDGNLVGYKNRVPFDYSTGEPYWSSGTVVHP